jgi:spore maturation protein CgeB
LRAIYSFNKHGFEERYWLRELAYANGRDEIIPFNHGGYVHFSRIMRAQLLDNLYFAKDPDLMFLYGEIERMIKDTKADCLIVDNVLPYHPEFLRTLEVYKVMRIADGPMSSYDRDFAYLHAYDHVLYHTPAYSADLGLAEKLRYLGAKRLIITGIAANICVSVCAAQPVTITCAPCARASRRIACRALATASDVTAQVLTTAMSVRPACVA